MSGKNDWEYAPRSAERRLPRHYVQSIVAKCDLCGQWYEADEDDSICTACLIVVNDHWSSGEDK
jgi:hypothetical protein